MYKVRLGSGGDEAMEKVGVMTRSRPEQESRNIGLRGEMTVYTLN
jgi:hypothetical protein